MTNEPTWKRLLDTADAEIASLRADLAAAHAHDVDQRAALAEQEREIARLREAVERAYFIIGGHTHTVDDCDERALRENAQKALVRLRAALAGEGRESNTHADAYDASPDRPQ